MMEMETPPDMFASTSGMGQHGFKEEVTLMGRQSVTKAASDHNLFFKAGTDTQTITGV
tara:strand:+ start:455 stop:628 length:174 start_codon:yes stop_codon:yes gene_type:complete